MLKMISSKYLELQFTKIKTLKLLSIYLTNGIVGVFTVLMYISNIKFINKIKDLKTVIIKRGIFMSLAAYWGVILVGTFITFN